MTIVDRDNRLFYLFSSSFDDIDPLKSTHDINEAFECDFVFVCVPTPMNKDGSQNRDFIENVFFSLLSSDVLLIVVEDATVFDVVSELIL